jgi:fibronectin-binding autotransporter adhesin
MGCSNNSTASQTLSGIISGSGTLIQDGPGTLTLTGVETYIGDTYITNSTLSNYICKMV